MVHPRFMKVQEACPAYEESAANSLHGQLLRHGRVDNITIGRRNVKTTGLVQSSFRFRFHRPTGA